ncbi:MAG: 30S ribosomal protein S4 [Dehalococcoidia bacterium]|jgi:small subunit ribosomal protein S4|nr:30S ribosomal protein S4 [Chloroflexota bacterium]MCH2494301.1 30S ribosomal protein S4 [Dehalococcoidia bacterium]MQF84003.1 30S ribosomal protein S4 [SAR202 cluster bacterium]MAQ48465.1 30S ribosomal protein S4 [Chloroflexota bacterium]MBS17348.1 30S ribosomal protein S4 [Chloroflexota bacterium]|tara:strand:- start:6214 stop:6795 length:582 start_codon:yes stop_codon:yes gene_type:complete
MARYTGPVNKKMRFLGLEIAKKSGKNRMSPRRRLSPYGLQLREKQKARFLYGILERQFRNYYDKASNIEGSTGDELLILLEKRFDNVMFRTGMFNTRRQSRQAVNHGHFLINDKKVNIPSYQIKQGDKITWKEKSKNSSLFQIASENIKNNQCAKWLTLDKSGLSVQINNLPSASDAELEIDTRQIVEYYSRR